jgi:DNA-binding FadR family transcriptional regulator
MRDSLTTLTRRVVFAPLDDQGRTQTVARRIRSAITLGIYANEEQLPTEITLAMQFNISPVTLRDALRVLREEGLVRTTRGRSGGTVVVAPDESNLLLFENALTELSTIELRDLLDWQTAVTSRAAALSAERATAYDVETLIHTLSGLQSAGDPIAARRAVSRFLIELAASSRSARISREAINLQIEFAPHATLALRSPESRQEAFVVATRVVEALRARDGEAARDEVVALIDLIGTSIQGIHHALTHPASGRARSVDGEDR